MIMISVADIEKSCHSTHAHALLRECLKRKDIDYVRGETEIVKNPHGKPYLKERPDVFFNVSHADGICACIVSDKECGIDCERVRERRPGVMKRAFSDTEKALVENSSDPDLTFFRLWTLKEAFVKTIGIGISYPMASACFDLSDNGITSAPEGFRFMQYIIKGGFVVSVCEKVT